MGQPQNENKNKTKLIKYSIIAAVLLASIGVGVYFLVDGLNQQKASNANRFISEDNKQMTISYNFNTEITTTSKDYEGIPRTTNTIHASSSARFTPIYNPDTNTYTVMITYNAIDIQNGDQDLEESEVNHSEELVTGQIVYVAIIDANSGKILSLKKAFGLNDEVLNQITIMQLNQIFPDIQRTNPSNANLVEETAQGVFNTHNKVSENGQNLILEKNYDNNDQQGQSKFQDEHSQIKSKVSEKLITKKEKPVVEEGQFQMTVEYNFDTNRRQLNDNDDDNGQDVAIFSNMQVDVNAGINQAGVDHQLTAEEILAIIDEFGEVDDVQTELNQDQFGITVFDYSDEGPDFESDARQDEQGQGRFLDDRRGLAADYFKEHYIIKKKFFGKELALVIEFSTDDSYGTGKLLIKMDGKTIKTLLSLTYNLCGKPTTATLEKDFTKRIIEGKYPIAAVLQATFDFDVQFVYGFEIDWDSLDAAHGCKLTFTPFLKPGFTAYGGASITLYKGGVYGSGSFANTYLELVGALSLNPLEGSITGNLIIIPFEYEIGLFLQSRKCKFKNWKLKCYWSDPQTWGLYDDSLGKQYKKQLFKFSFD